jgi:colanic acid/amylovoran biosynthesis protein
VPSPPHPREPVPAKRVVITTTASLNGGDAALLQAQLHTIDDAFPGASVTIYDQQAEVARRYRPHLDFRSSLVWPRREPTGRVRVALTWMAHLGRVLVAASALRLRKARLARVLAPHRAALHDLERYRDADVVMTNAGTMLMAHYRYEPRLVDYAIAHILGTPVVHFTQTMGPFGRRWSNPILRGLLARARLVLLRGELSAAHVRALGAGRATTAVVADPVFALTNDDDLEHGRSRRLPTDRPRVGISVRDWPFFDGQADYERAVAELCTALVRQRGAEVVFVSTCQGIPEYWVDDSRVADRIVAALYDDVRASATVDRGFHDTDDLRDALAGLDVMIATRLHVAILALTSGTPTIPIAYEPKAREVFARLEAPDLPIDIDQVSGGRLLRHVDGVWPHLDERRWRLFDAVASERQSALGVADLLRGALGELRADPVDQ